jgi:hypothetical protein
MGAVTVSQTAEVAAVVEVATAQAVAVVVPELVDY